MENPFKIILMDLYKLSPAKKLLTGTVARIMKRLQKEFHYATKNNNQCCSRC